MKHQSGGTDRIFHTAAALQNALLKFFIICFLLPGRLEKSCSSIKAQLKNLSLPPLGTRRLTSEDYTIPGGTYGT